MPSFPKDILFSGGRAYVEGCAQFIALWETCAPARIASGAGSSPSTRLLFLVFLSGLCPRVRSSLGSSSCAPLHDRKETPLYARRRRESREKGGRRQRDDDDDASRRVPRKRETTLVVVVVVVVAPDESLFPALAIHISRHESTDRYRRGPLRENDSSRFDSRRVFADWPSVLFTIGGYLRLAFTDKWLDLLPVIQKSILQRCLLRFLENCFKLDVQIQLSQMGSIWILNYLFRR